MKALLVAVLGASASSATGAPASRRAPRAGIVRRRRSAIGTRRA